MLRFLHRGPSRTRLPKRRQVPRYLPTLEQLESRALPAATTIDLDPTGSATQAGTIQVAPPPIPGFPSLTVTQDQYIFTAEVTGRVSVLMRAESADFLSKVTAPGTTILDSAVFASPLYGARDNVIQFHVDAGSTYQLVATGDRPPILVDGNFLSGSTGNYELIISTETAAFPATAVLPISLDPSGSGLQLGTIASAAEVDQFSFTAPVTGQITVRVNGGVTNGGLFQESHFAATAGQSFQVQVSDPDATSQQPSLYVLTITTTTANADEFPDNQVFLIALDAGGFGGFGSQSGAINYSGDTDTFRFRAPLSGTMTLIMRTTDFSGLQSQVSVSPNTVISDIAPPVPSDGSHPGNDHIVKFHVHQGTEYTVTVSGNHDTSGPYQLSLDLRTNRPIPETPLITQVTSTSTNTRLAVFSPPPFSTGNTGGTVTVPSRSERPGDPGNQSPDRHAVDRGRPRQFTRLQGLCAGICDGTCEYDGGDNRAAH